VKVSFVKGDPDRDGVFAPGDGDLIGRLRSEIDGWKPRRGPDLRDLLARAAANRNLWVFYPAMSAVLVIVLLEAFLLMISLHIGSLGGQPVHAQLGR
jgi:hypothetical protein